MRGGVLLLAAVALVARIARGAAPANVLPELTLPDQPRVVVVAPHPDDETIACGGLIARLTRRRLPVDVVFVTNGDGYPEALGASRAQALPPAQAFVALGRRRWREALEATHHLGLHRGEVHFLGFPDGGLAALWHAHWSQRFPFSSPFTIEDHPPYPDVFDPRTRYDGEDLTEILARIIAARRPNVVVLPHPADVHRDHSYTGLFVIEAVQKLEADDRLPKNTLLLTYLVHDPVWPPEVSESPELPAPPPRITATRWRTLHLTPAELQIKTAALDAYASQLAVMPDLLRRFLRPNEIYGRIKSALVARIAAEH